MYKLIFDRSIFHGDKFDKLRMSKLARCVHRNRLKIFFTPQFIEETFQFVLKDRSAFQDHWAFLSSLNRARWFKNAEDIVALELGNEPRRQGYYLRPKSEIQMVLDGCAEFMSDNSPPNKFQNTLKEIRHNRDIRIQFRKTRLNLRNSVPPGNYDLNKYFENNVDWFIENGLMKYHTNSVDYLKNWSANKKTCRFTKSYVKAWFATVLLPVIDRTLKVDQNDRADAEQLAYLLWTDIIVSDDIKFMRECFNLLYERQGKKFMTLSEFLTFLESRN